MPFVQPIGGTGYYSVDFTVGYVAQSVDFTVAQPQSVDVTVAAPQSVDFTLARPQSLDFTVASAQSADFTVQGPLSVNFTVAQSQSVDFTLAVPQSVDFTVAAPQSVDFTVQGTPLSVDFTVAQAQSADFTVYSPSPLSVDFTVQDPPLYTLSGPGQVVAGTDATYTLTLRPGLTLSAPLSITPALADGTGSAVACVFTPSPVSLSDAAPQATFTLNTSAQEALLLSVTHTGPAGYDPPPLPLSTAGDGGGTPIDLVGSFVIYRGWGVDGTQTSGNRAAASTSCRTNYPDPGYMYDNVGNLIGTRVAYTSVTGNAVGSGLGITTLAALDWTCVNNSLGPFEPAGAWPVWIGDGSVVVLYRAQDTLTSVFKTWWRRNQHNGEQTYDYDHNGDPQQGGGYPPPITRDTPMGNWSARVQVNNLPTHQIVQMAHGQGRVAALVNTGTLRYVPPGPYRYDDFRQSNYKKFMPGYVQNICTSGDLLIYYATDALCQTWAGPYVVANNVTPNHGGLCWTGEAWLACYTNAELGGLSKRCGNLGDWSGAPAVPTGIFREADNPQDPNGLGQFVGRKECYCYGLAYDERNVVNGLWAPFDYTPDQFPVFAGGNAGWDDAGYGSYTSVYSDDQGRTWSKPGINAGLGTIGILHDGGGMSVEGTAFVRLPRPQAALLRSTSAFHLDGGTNQIP